MRKFCKILSILFFFIAILYLFGCKESKNNNLYFDILKVNYEMFLSETKNIEDVKYKTNIPGTINLTIKAENEEVVSIDKNYITAISVGVTKINFNVEYKNEIYSDFVILQVVKIDDEESMQVNKTINQVNDKINIVIFEVYKANINYEYFDFYIEGNNNLNILQTRKFGCKLEVIYNSDYKFTLKIENKLNNKDFVIIDI